MRNSVWSAVQNRLKVLFFAAVLIFAAYIIASTHETVPNDGEALAQEAAASPLIGAVVVVDPGHGGYDCGAVGSFTGVLEKDLNLAVALKLRDLLTQGGAAVVMTRDTDKALCPEDAVLGTRKKADMAVRANMIEEAGTDVVLSIHMNKYTNARYYGAQVFYLEDGPPQEGKDLATCIQQALRDGLDPANTRQEKAGDYYILRMRPASVLIECGFLSNRQEEALLAEDSYQEKVAWAIYAGLVDYLSATD